MSIQFELFKTQDVTKNIQPIDLFSSTEAATYLRYSENTLRISRVKGLLGGKITPQYRKIGGRVYYKKADLDRWIESIPFQTKTSQKLSSN